MRAVIVLLCVAACSKDSDVAAERLDAPKRVIGVPNVDFTNQWSKERVGDNDQVPFEVVPGNVERLAWRLTLGDRARHHRIWWGDRVLLDKDTDSVVLPWTGEPLELALEVGDFQVSTELTVEELDASYEVADSAVIELSSSPLLLNHHLQQSELLMSVAVNSYFENTSMIADYQDILGDRFLDVPGGSYGLDVWIQDELELAWGTAPDGRRMDIAIDSIRDRGLDPMPEDILRGEDFGVMTWGQGYANSFDSFGNLETTPPIDGYPYGRIYYGAVPGAGPVDAALHEKLVDQGLQDPFTVDTSWLCVGHVDEIMSFVPDPTAPRGFRFVFSDTGMAWDLLDAMDPATPLPRYAGTRNHDIDTVGEFVSDAGLRALNDDIQADHLEPILEAMRAEVGLTDDEIVRIPGLFEEPRGCGPTVAAVIPGMANLVVDNEPGGPTRIFMADPFVREDLSDPDSDPFIAAVRAQMPPDAEVHFLDDWEAYHIALGEVHCGTNVIRTPGAEWW